MTTTALGVALTLIKPVEVLGGFAPDTYPVSDFIFLSPQRPPSSFTQLKK